MHCAGRPARGCIKEDCSFGVCRDESSLHRAPEAAELVAAANERLSDTILRANCTRQHCSKITQTRSDRIFTPCSNEAFSHLGSFVPSMRGEIAVVSSYCTYRAPHGTSSSTRARIQRIAWRSRMLGMWLDNISIHSIATFHSSSNAYALIPCFLWISMTFCTSS